MENSRAFLLKTIRDMSSAQRLAVWKGERSKTSGGLTKKDLVKNKRGKIVSKRKSDQAGKDNNLGEWLRAKDVSVPKDKMLHAKKGKKKAAPKPKKAPPKAPPKKKSKPKPAPHKVPKKAPKKAAKKAAKKGPKINPLTKQPYDPDRGGKISVDNIIGGDDLFLD